MRLLTCDELCELLSDSEHGYRYMFVRYSKRDKKLGAKGSFGVLCFSGCRYLKHLAWFDDYNTCRDFLSSMLKGVK